MITINNIKFADCGYYINLDSRTDRRNNIENQLITNNITGIVRHKANESSDSGPQNCKNSHYELYVKFLENTTAEILMVIEDDCLFLPYLFDHTNEIHDNIFSNNFDLFWLGCRNRRWPHFVKNKCYRVQSVAHTQSYLIKRNLCEYILNNFPLYNHNGLAIDELLCLVPYGYDVAFDPNKFNFYSLDDPLNNLPIFYNSLCYERALTTQYKSYSDLSHFDCDYENYITSSFPVQ